MGKWGKGGRVGKGERGRGGDKRYDKLAEGCVGPHSGSGEEEGVCLQMEGRLEGRSETTGRGPS